MLRAGAALEEFTRGKSYSDYEASLLLRSAVERQLEIVGDALNQLLIHAPSLEPRFTYRRQIKGFRNVLAHELWTLITRLSGVSLSVSYLRCCERRAMYSWS